ARLRESLGVELPLRALFEHPTVEGLSVFLEKSGLSREYMPLVPLRFISGGRALFCIPPAGGSAMVFMHLAKLVDKNWSIIGIQARGLELQEAPFESIEEMVRCYVDAIVAHQKCGPYHFVGYSAGAAIAHEIACELERVGEEVALMVNFDGYVPRAHTSQKEQTKAEAIKEILIEFGGDINMDIDYDSLLSLLLNYMVKEGLMPAEAQVEYVDRIVEELVLNSQRSSGYRLHQGSFRTIYFAADAVAVSKETIKDRDKWRNYCSEVEYVSVPVKHMTMLGEGASSIIALNLNRYLSELV
ncbi:MAG: hypothetical protein EB015_17890, partial [Methylocystaceae bacterium]|nr:hypothetical protein [Methylocystaceae bacterium]